MKFLLDTDVFSALAKQRSDAAMARFAVLPAGHAAISVVTWGEVLYGLARHPVRQRLVASIDALRTTLRLLPVAAETAPIYARLRAQLQSQGTPIGANDYWIAAHALAENLTLVTGNEREFARVPGLKVENWLR